MAVNINTDAEITSIRLDEQVSAPTPDTGYSHIFAKADGLYIVDDDDVVTGPFDVAGASLALDNLESVAINVSLVSDTDSTDSLGSTGVKWLQAFLDSISLGEIAAAPADVEGDGQIWVKSDTPNTLWFTDDAGTDAQLGSSASADHGYYTYLAATLEPMAIEPIQKGAFTYAVASNATKILTASWNTRLGTAGRMEIRTQRDFLFLRDVTLTGLTSTACGMVIDPTTPTYTNARDTYYDRLLTIAESAPQYLGIPATTTLPFLPGAYGAIVLQSTNYNSAWNSVRTNADVYGWAIDNEINDSSAFRYSVSLRWAVSKYVVNEFRNSSGSDTGEARGSSLIYFLCPSTWSDVADATSYDFRDDFMGASIDTGSDWTRAESTAGNVEINTLYQWCKLKGNDVWGTNGMYAQTGISRAAGKIFLIDIFTGRDTSVTHGHIVGFSDGTGHSYIDFAHGVWFGTTGSADILKVFEDGTDRGEVGSGYLNGTTYRVRITLGTSNAAYAIQGGTYGDLGSATWTDITPGTTSSTTTPVYAGISAYDSGTMHVSDARVY